MSVLIGIALKSLLVAGLTLALLALMKRRSAAERSWVAHIGLLALIIMAFAPLVLPRWTVEAPALFSPAPAVETQAAPPAAAVANASRAAPVTDLDSPVMVPAKATASRPSISSAAVASAIYAVPAAILLLITALALIRLVALQARADVLVDGHWLTALAQAQRRMGFKRGTALLTSNALASPISWGLVRPVILLNSRAVEASDEAEAIIAHELAHVARGDQVKLLLARVATALFWFNPLVWMLAREAHQLREETADDAVLAADIPDTDYAQLLVGVARHECPGMLLGAHGVAPSKSSLARRVARVLDGKLVRGPAARGFATGVFVGAVMVAAPLAALTLTPGGAKLVNTRNGTVSMSEGSSAYYPATRDGPADLPHIIARGVSTSMTSAAAVIGTRVETSPNGATVTVKADGTRVATSPTGATVTIKPDGTRVATSADGATVIVKPDGTRVETSPNGANVIQKQDGTIVTTSPSGANVVRKRDGTTVAASPSGASITVYPPDPSGQRKVVAVSPSGATQVSHYPASDSPDRIIGDWPGFGRRNSAIDRAVEMKAVGVTPEYVASIKSALPQLHLSSDDLVQLRSVGVSPDFIQELARQGYRNVDADDISGAYAVGVRSDYIRGMAAAGYPRLSLEQLTELKSVGVTPKDVERFKRAGFGHLNVDELMEAKTSGLTPEELRAARDDP